MEENTILVKENLSDVVVKFVVYKPLIAQSAKAGQFVILRGREGGERIPVTLVDWDKEKGTILRVYASQNQLGQIMDFMKAIGVQFDVQQDV